MAGETPITVVGRLTGDPELRFVQSGAPVVNFNVAHNARKFNKTTNEWEDTEASFYPCSLWGTGAENVAETLRKGNSVIVEGVIGSRSWEQDGQKRSRMEVRVNNIGLNLLFVKVEPENVLISTPKSSGGGQQAAPAQQAAPQGGAENDPWATPAGQGEPPF